MHVRLTAVVPALVLAAVSTAWSQTQSTTLTIQAGTPKAESSSTLYGLMTEEINHSYEGGLYGELLRNNVIYTSGWGATDYWAAVQRGTSQAKITVDSTSGPSAALPMSLHLEVTSATEASPAGVENGGYWGIPLRPNTLYHATVYAKASQAGTPVVVTLLSDDTGRAIVQKTIPEVGTTWKQYSVDLTTPSDMQPSSTNHFVLSVTRPGSVWFNLATLFGPNYKGRPNGTRIDLMEKMAAMHPAFLRFPGGNYLEGNDLKDWYDWKKTIGPLVDRPGHASPWDYHSTDGFGLLEFFEWCQDLHMQPVLAVYAGYSLNGKHIDPGPALEPYVQSALNEIEWASGSTSTQWGAVRAKDGHPEPFHLHYIEIGNEDQFDKSGSYSARYAQFYAAIKKKYPQLELIATAPVTGHTMDVIDEHYYESAQAFFEDAHHYDKTDRKGPKIFVGEWATREGSPTPNFGAALSDAAWMTGMERNSDIVVMSSYAPLLTNVNPGGLEWDTDLIGFNAMTSYGSPSYYAQVMFSGHHGDQILAGSLSGNPVRIYQSVTRDSKTGAIYIKLVNGTNLPADVSVKLEGGANIPTSGTMETMTAPSTEDTNSITDPKNIVPKDHAVSGLGDSFPVHLDPLSINVLTLGGGQ